MTGLANPPVRKDGRCAGCGGSREKTRAHKDEHNGGTRLERSFWRAAVERDPFCSRECCERFHGLLVDESPRKCDQCGEGFKPTVAQNGAVRANQRFCSRSCAEKYRRGRSNFASKGKCVECGGPHDGRTIGCRHCWDRKTRRERRVNDPVFIAREQAENETRKAKRKAQREAEGRALCQRKPSPAAPEAGIEPTGRDGSPTRGDLQTSDRKKAA